MIDLAGIVILAGGESSRMGSPKALLTLPNGETLLEWHINHAKSLSTQLRHETNLKVPVMIADNGKNFYQPSYLEKGKVIVIADELPSDDNGKGAGALSAIANAMLQVVYPEDYLMVISCDCLIGANQLYHQLFDRVTNKHEDVIYLKGEKDYPLLGLYRTDLLLELYEYLDKGNRSVMKFLVDKTVKMVELPDAWVNLANFNTKDKFELALQKLEN